MHFFIMRLSIDSTHGLLNTKTHLLFPSMIQINFLLVDYHFLDICLTYPIIISNFLILTGFLSLAFYFIRAFFLKILVF